MRVTRSGPALFLLGGINAFVGPFFGFGYGDKLGGLIFIGACGFALITHHRGNTRAARSAQVAVAGTRAVATILSIESVAGNLGSKWKFCLDLEVPGGGRRQVTLEEEVSDDASYCIREGMRLPVIIDSTDPDRVILVW